MLEPDQRRELKYFFEDFVRLIFRLIYDLFQIFIKLIQGVWEMVFPSNKNS